MFEGEQRTAYERLSELVSEVAGAIRRLDENLFGSLIEPFSHRQNILPVASSFESRVRSHIYGCSCYWPRANASAHTVSNLSSCAGSGTVERFDCCREVVSLSFQRDDALDRFRAEEVAC